MAEHKALLQARERAQQGVAKLRDALRQEFSGRDDIIVGVNGSYARGEVTTGSDVDVFVLGLYSGVDHREDQARVVRTVSALGFKPPSPGGVFENPLCLADITTNIGGQKDTNESITRRMLFLLEGEWLFNKKEFETARRTMISAYVKENIASEKVCRYLLSDIIRYWRTMCVDYEYKQASGKPPGVRRIKLRFSRCIMYFAGVLAVAETVGLDAKEKRSWLEKSFGTPAAERIDAILGANSDRLLQLYDFFLAAIDQPAIRDRLEQNDYESSSEYQSLRGQARDFRNELVAQLRKRYPPEHDVMYGLLV